MDVRGKVVLITGASAGIGLSPNSHIKLPSFSPAVAVAKAVLSASESLHLSPMASLSSALGGFKRSRAGY